jgi:ABC-2 type transport system ATP-binding protein
MDNILESKNLSKSYFTKKALNNVNLEIQKGKVVGLLGPNGSGKTTFIKIAAGILRKSSGEILIDGKKPGVETKAVVSYLPDRNYLYKWMKIRDAVELFKDFYDDFDDKKCEELLKFMKLEEEAKYFFIKRMMEKLNLLSTIKKG